MQIHVLAATNRQPAWIDTACNEYAKRLRVHAPLVVREIPLARRRRNETSTRYCDDEARRMLAALPARAHVVALAETGAPWSTAELVDRLRAWSRDGVTPTFLIGGPDGLGAAALAEARETWALSRLTLPHGLARLIVIEALYRAFSVLAGHPYHRG